MPKTRKKFDESTLTEYSIQAAPLLRLPRELRDSIYEFAVLNIESISVTYDGLTYCPPLSLVCRQTREEYREVFLEKAPEYASRVVIHLSNFQARTPTYHIPPIAWTRPAPGILRTFTIRSSLTHVVGLYHARFLPIVSEPWDDRQLYHCERLIPDDIEIYYEPKTLDVAVCKDYLRECCHARHTCNRCCSHIPCLTAALTKGFFQAIERYASKDKASVSKRKRVRFASDA